MKGVSLTLLRKICLVEEEEYSSTLADLKYLCMKDWSGRSQNSLQAFSVDALLKNPSVLNKLRDNGDRFPRVHQKNIMSHKLHARITLCACQRRSRISADERKEYHVIS